MPAPSGSPVSLRPDVLGYLLLELAFDGALIATALRWPEAGQYVYSAQYPLLSFLIFGVFGAGVVLSWANLTRLFREERHLLAAIREEPEVQELGPWIDTLPASALKGRLMALKAHPERGADGDKTGRAELEDAEEIRTGWGKYLGSVLTMLGLLGTFLGLMVAIQSMRGLLALEDFQAFFGGVVGALDGMGTAFSTSLAGIAGALILSFQHLLLYNAQLAWLGRMDAFVGRRIAPRLLPREAFGGLEVELARLREALSDWRTDGTLAGIELRSAAEALAERTTIIADTSAAVLTHLDERDGRWRQVEDALDGLRRLAEGENRVLLELAGQRLGRLEEPVGPVADPAAPPTDGDPGAESLRAELRRSNDLLTAIYRELGLAVRSSAQKLEGNQADMSRLIHRLLQRSEHQATQATHQILLLRNLLQYLGQDEARLKAILADVARAQAQGAPPEEGR